MSYDLYFLVAKDRRPISASEFESYFSSRPNYKVEGSQALYGNEATGVYFTFDHSDGSIHDDEELEIDDEEGAPKPPEDGWQSAGVSFNINYFRPHFFGMEAAPELEAFVEHFDLTVDDPQNEGMGRGEFSQEGFLKGWNAGNLFGYSALVAQLKDSESEPAHELAQLPTERLEQVWRWNYNKDRLQEQMAEQGRDVFVPTIMIASYAGRVGTMHVWPDGIPTAAPAVDWLLMGRDELAPRGWLGRRKQDMSVIEYSQARGVIEQVSTHRVDDDSGSYRLMSHERPPQSVLDLFAKLTPMKESDKPQVLAMDQVLNVELFEAAAAMPKGSMEEIRFDPAEDEEGSEKKD